VLGLRYLSNRRPEHRQAQKLSKRSALYKAKRKIEKAKARIRAKAEHPFRVIKRQFGYVKTRFRGLTKTPHNWIMLEAEQTYRATSDHP
jgi:hypothetical protein